MLPRSAMTIASQHIERRLRELRVTFTPTDEQVAILEACRAGKNVTIEAGAGTGKTATMRLIAEALPNKKILYGAFNKSIATEAQAKFPSNTTCKTIHALAFAQVGRRYKQRLNGPRQPGKETAHRLGITERERVGTVDLKPATIARLAAETVDRFCNSDDDRLRWRHVPQVLGIDQDTDAEASAALKRLVLPYAETIWADLQHADDEGGGKFRFTHNAYRKLFALQRPRLPYDVIVLDEAQDSSPVVAELLLNQPHAQVICVGDAAQSIYGFAGASMQAIRSWPADVRLQLTQSFRFGHEVAAEGNKWLAMLARVDQCDMRISGTGHSVVGPAQRPDAVLCRTNGKAAEEVMAAQQSRIPVALVGGGDEIKRLAQACKDMQAGRESSHPELVAFRAWSEVQDFCRYEAAGVDLRAFVQLIDNRGADVVIKAMDRLVPEDQARRIISTAHRGKGREFAVVRIADDFEEPTDDRGNPTDPSPEEVRLAYVAVTRAQNHLDPGGLTWINNRMVSGSVSTAG